MEIRTSDADTFVKAAYLLGTLDRSRFTEEQLEIVDSALEAIERVKQAKIYNNERKKKYVQAKREADPTYAQRYERKEHATGQRGRPKKVKEKATE